MSSTVSVTFGQSSDPRVAQADVAWFDGMNAQDAMEEGYNALKGAPGASFALQYYGSTLGNMVIMIANKYQKPGYYWEFLYNGQPAIVGINSQILNPGDTIEFRYSCYDTTTHGEASMVFPVDDTIQLLETSNRKHRIKRQRTQ